MSLSELVVRVVSQRHKGNGLVLSGRGIMGSLYIDREMIMVYFGSRNNSINLWLALMCVRFVNGSCVQRLVLVEQFSEMLLTTLELRVCNRTKENGYPYSKNNFNDNPN